MNETPPDSHEEIEAKMNALKGLEVTLDLLSSAHFNINDLQKLKSSIQFITSLHTELYKYVLEHPDAHQLFPELNSKEKVENE